MRWILVALALLLTVPVHAANLPTPTATIAAATPAAVQTADVPQRVDQVTKEIGGKRFERPIIMDAGGQFGSTSDGASLITRMQRGTCVLDLPAFAAVPTPVVGPPRVQKINCTATGAAVGDSVFVSLARYGEGEYVGLQLDSATVIAANVIELQFTQGSLAGLDPAPQTVHYLVVR